MNWAIHQSQFRFDIRAEREEGQRLLMHQAQVLQDRLVRRSRTNRTKKHAIPEWEKSTRRKLDNADYCIRQGF
jgi:hypothetical protein